jgi:hypothetical protein
MAINLKGEELKAVDFSIKLIDFILDIANQDDDARHYICINDDILYIDNIESYFINDNTESDSIYAIDGYGKAYDEDLNEYRNENGNCVYIPEEQWKNYKQLN